MPGLMPFPGQCQPSSHPTQPVHPRVDSCRPDCLSLFISHPFFAGYPGGLRMHQAPAVSRPLWMRTLPGGSGAARRSPVEIVANAASYVTRTPVADRSGLRAGWLGRWTDGVTALGG